MNPFAEKTSTDVFNLLSTLHEQLERQEQVTSQWRRGIEGQLRHLEDQLRHLEDRLTRIENTLRTAGR